MPQLETSEARRILGRRVSGAPAEGDVLSLVGGEWVPGPPTSGGGGGGGGGSASGSLPVGTVFDWFRPSASFPIPAGTQICDGSAITVGPYAGFNVPDERGRFRRGVSNPDSYFGVTNVGGSQIHRHNTPLLPHTHLLDSVPPHVHGIPLEPASIGRTGFESDYNPNANAPPAQGLTGGAGPGPGGHDHNVQFPAHNHGGSSGEATPSGGQAFTGVVHNPGGGAQDQVSNYEFHLPPYHGYIVLMQVE